jgi:hypothetical protein
VVAVREWVAGSAAFAALWIRHQQHGQQAEQGRALQTAGAVTRARAEKGVATKCAEVSHGAKLTAAFMKVKPSLYCVPRMAGAICAA